MKRIALTLSAEEYIFISALAKNEHLPVSTFVKRIALNQDKRTPSDFKEIGSKLNIYEGWVANPAPPGYTRMNGSQTAFYSEAVGEKYIVVITNGKKEVTLDEDSPYFKNFN